MFTAPLMSTPSVVAWWLAHAHSAGQIYPDYAANLIIIGNSFHYHAPSHAKLKLKRLV